MNPAADCPECCECPAPIFRGRSASVMRSKCGFGEYPGFEGDHPRVFRKRVKVQKTIVSASGATGLSGSGPYYLEVVYSGAGGTLQITTTEEYSGENCTVATIYEDNLSAFPFTGSDYLVPIGTIYYRLCGGEDYYPPETTVTGVGRPSLQCGASPDVIESATKRHTSVIGESRGTWVGDPCGEDGLEHVDTLLWSIENRVDCELSVEDTAEDVLARAESALAIAFAAATGGVLIATRNVSADELSVLLGKFAYEVAFPVPKVGNGKCWRAEWVERFVPELVIDTDTESPTYNQAIGGGTSIASIEILHRGVFRPEVTIGGDGSGAHAVAVMAPNGAVASIRLLNPGSGYTEPPEITFSAGNDDNTATATAVIETDEASPNYGRITAINLTAGGDYLPELTFSPPPAGGTQAEGTVTLDPTGGLASVNITNAGSRYTSITCNLGGLVFIHYGVETARCHKFSGTAPEDYDEADSATWPATEERIVETPEADGIISLQLKRVVCDCSDCP